MVEGTHHWRSGDISGAPVMSRLFNIMRGGRVHLDVPKGIEFPVGIRTLLNTSRYVTTCTSGLSSLKSTMSRLVFWASVPLRPRLVVILCPTHSYRDSWATRCLSASCAIPPP